MHVKLSEGLQLSLEQDGAEFRFQAGLGVGPKLVDTHVDRDDLVAMLLMLRGALCQLGDLPAEPTVDEILGLLPMARPRMTP